MKLLSRFCNRSYVVVSTCLLISGLLHWHPAFARQHGSHDYKYQKSSCPFDTRGYDLEHLQCAYLTVPENRKKTDRRTIRLTVARMAASVPTRDPTPIMFIQGGPGGRSLGLHLHFVQLLHRWFPRHDIIVYDARGTGYSGALCPELNASGAYRNALDLTAKESRRMEDSQNRACHDLLRKRGVDVSGYTTQENAADINDIRLAFGYRKLDLLAISYGPMVAQALIRDYPHTVRAAVLYAPVPLSGLAHHAETYLATFGRALDKLFALCRRQPACNAAYPHLKKTFGETVQMLEKRPLQVPLNGQVPGLQTYVVNAQDFIEILHGHMHQSEMAGLPALIEAFHERNVKRLRPIVEPTLHDDGLDRATYYSVTCHDGPPSRRARRRLTSAWPSLEETVGIAWDLGGVACGYWESGQASAAALNPGSSDTPVLVIHGSLDPIISTEDVTTVMESYPRSRVIELPGAGHAPSQRTIACTAHLFAAFYRHPSASLDTTCVKKLPPLLFKLPEAD